MDPFSVTVGAVGLADSGMTLAGFLQDKYKAYRDAPKEILEIADEVQFCSSLVDTLSASLDKAVDSYSSAFVRDARTLVTKIKTVFKDIYRLIPEDRALDKDVRARWRFALDKKKLAENQQRLRQLQQNFIFMETMHRYHKPHAPVSDGPLGQGGSFDGVLQAVPVQMNVAGAKDNVTGANTTTTYQATLTLRPAPPPAIRTSKYSSVEPRMTMDTGSPDDGKRRLEGMRRSPHFSMSLFKDKAPKMERYSWKEEEARPEERKAKQREDDNAGLNTDVVSLDEASKDVDILKARWFDDDSNTGYTGDTYLDSEENDILEPYPAQATQGAYSQTLQPPDYPVNYNSAATDTTRPIPPAPRASQTHDKKIRDWQCDGCRRDMHARTRFNCGACDNFDYCRDCFDNPRITTKHLHRPGQFTELKWSSRA